MDYCKIIANTAGGILPIGGTAEEIVKAFRKCKLVGAHELKGKFRLLPTDRAAGLNIRKSRLDNGDAVYRIFEPFTATFKENLTFPSYDSVHKSVVATDGCFMLFCDTPDGFTLVDAEKGNFCTNAYSYFDWTRFLNGKYARANFTKACEVAKGSELHNILTIAACGSRAYRHHTNDGVWRNLCLWIGKRQYDPVRLLDLVNALFRLGSESVGLYLSGRWNDYKPMHIVGVGDGLNAGGLLMPLRHCPSAGIGGIEFPLEKTAANNAV